MSIQFLISTIAILALATAEELELLTNFYKTTPDKPTPVSPSGMLKASNDQTEDGDSTVAIVVVISCFVVFGVLVFIFYPRKRNKKEIKKSDETTQPLIVEELDVKLNFDLYKD